jgi:hypothetical protein
MNTELIWLLAGLIPVALFIGAGWWIISRDYPETVRRRSLLILALAAGVVLLGVIGMAAWLSPSDDKGLSLALLAPALLAACVIALVNLHGLAGARRSQLILISLLGLAFIGLLFGLDDSLGGKGIPGSLLVSLILGITWLISGRSDALAIELSIAAVLLLGLYNRSEVMGYPISDSNWVQAASRLLGFVPLMVVALSALLFTLGIKRIPAAQGDHPRSAFQAWYPALLRFGLAILLLAGLIYTILWGSIWDRPSDGMTGLVLSWFCSLVSIGAGVLMAFTLFGRQRIASLVFLIVVPVLLFQGFNLGWRISNLEITAGRATRIQRAVEHFYEREERYPKTLDELTPRDLLWIPGPVILQGESWCYQGGTHYYRLGAFYRDFIGLPLSVKVYAQAGMPPAAGWECAARLAEMKARYDWTQ